MGLTLTFPPGYSDLQDSALAANQPAFGIDLAKIYSNAAFGKVRIETFYFVDLKNGDTVPLPVSPIDGYVYSRNELIYQWSINSGNGSQNNNGMSGTDSLFYCAWLVDQSTGLVYSDEWYRRQGAHANVTHTNDGLLKVLVIAQRQLKNLVMASSPTYSSITGGWIAQDKPLTQQLAQGMNHDAKFSVVNTEVFYLGEYFNGQTVTLPHSPDDGYAYSAAECKFMFSWRWTALGTSSTLSQPPLAYGLLGPFIGAVNSSGVVSSTVKYIDDAGGLDTTNEGRLAVFAFCTRSATPTGFTLTGFQEIPFDDFMPGQPLPFNTVVNPVVEDIKEAIGTPEFFGPTTYKDGDNIPLPTSVIDPSYTYNRQELIYAWTWSDTTNQTGTHLRLPLFYGSINMTIGHVTLHVKRLPPGGGIVEDNDTLARISVIVIARRQAQIPAVPDTNTPTLPQDAGTGGNQVQDIPTVSTVEVNGSATTADPNFNDTTPAAPSGFSNIKWQKDASSPTKISAYVTSSSPLTTKGDIYTHSASADARQGVGSDGAVLFADSTQPNGIAWKPLSALLNVGQGVLFAHYADVGSVTTGETDLYSDSIAGGTLGSAGSAISARYGGVFVNSSSTKDLRVYFGGSLIFDSGALTTSAATSWDTSVMIVSESPTVIRATVSVTLTGASISAFATTTRLTGLTLGAANTLKITGQSGGSGPATNDIVAKAGLGWLPSGSLQLVIGFVIADGTIGVGVGPVMIAPHSGTITACKLVVNSSDPGIPLQIKIKQNGTDVFSADPSASAGATRGTVVTTTLLTSNPLPVAQNDIFTIDIVNGSSLWQFTAQLET